VPELSAQVADFLRESDVRIEQFINNRIDAPIPGFVPSDFVKVFAALCELQEKYLASGTLFCEWGSGFGVVASLAAMLHFDAYGIEIQNDLVDAAQLLADDFGLPVQFVLGSFIPPGGEVFEDKAGEFAWLDSGCGDCGYENLGLAPEDFDVVFAYPWPGEDQVISDLFEHFAAVGALLMTYHGLEDLRLHRKTGRAR